MSYAEQVEARHRDNAQLLRWHTIPDHLSNIGMYSPQGTTEMAGVAFGARVLSSERALALAAEIDDDPMNADSHSEVASALHVYAYLCEALDSATPEGRSDVLMRKAEARMAWQGWAAK